MKKLRITFEGKAYEVLVEVIDAGPAGTPAPATPAAPVRSGAVELPPTPPAAPTRVSPAATPPAAGTGVVASPLAGKVVSVDVAVGEIVADGTKLATIEAMKMNTVVYADRPGKVMAIHVQPGDAVDAEAALLWIA